MTQDMSKKVAEHAGLSNHVKTTAVLHHSIHSWKEYLNLVFCSSGILICYFYFGIMQESITHGKYGADGTERFTYTLALVFVQCAVNTAFANILRKKVQDTVPKKMYALVAMSYLLAMVSSNHALQFIPYPTQVLGKSCKPIPIMIFGFLFAGKKYHWRKYIYVLMIVFGVALFLYKERPNTTNGRSVFDVGFGEMYLLVSLAMDGSTGAIQDRIRRDHTVNGHSMMFYMNIFSSAYLLLGLLFTGELYYFAVFVKSNPSVLINMVRLSAASTIGQYFIFKTVADFGPLTCSIVTTTRKLFTILASVVLFGNALSQRQFVATFIVFTALILDAVESKRKRQPAKTS